MEGDILQIIPALPGYSAVYATDDGGFEKLPLVCFALEEGARPEYKHIRCMYLSPESCIVSSTSDDDACLGIDFPGCTLDWAARAKEQAEEDAETAEQAAERRKQW